MVTASVVGAVGSSRAAKRAGLSATQRVLAIIAAVIVPWLPVAAGAAAVTWFPRFDTAEVLIPLIVMFIVSYACYLGLFSWLRLDTPGSRAFAVAAGLGGIFVTEFIAGFWLIASFEGVEVYLAIAAVVTAGALFLMLGLPSKRGRSGADVIFGLPPRHVPGPSRDFGGPPPGQPWRES